jgi:hypothetical protein
VKNFSKKLAGSLIVASMAIGSSLSFAQGSIFSDLSEAEILGLPANYVVIAGVVFVGGVAWNVNQNRKSDDPTDPGVTPPPPTTPTTTTPTTPTTPTTTATTTTTGT